MDEQNNGPKPPTVRFKLEAVLAGARSTPPLAGNEMSDSDQIASLIESARDAHARGDFVLALALCAEAITISPTNFKARFMRALVNQATQNHTDAIAEFTDILAASDRTPVTSAALYSRAVSHHAMGRIDNAADCRATLEIDADHFDARYLHCITLKAMGEIEQAIAEATRLIDARPNYNEAIYTRATLRHMNADWSGSVDDFTMYLQNTGTSGEFQHTAYFFRGVSYHYLNANDKALADLNRALTLQPDNATALARRALVYSALGQAEESAADIQRSKDLLNAKKAS
jgi:tetratricopeptide (TPR) repeat protein